MLMSGTEGIESAVLSKASLSLIIVDCLEFNLK
jgi:hypothetical protein